MPGDVRFRQTYPRMIRKPGRIVRLSRGRKVGEDAKAVRTPRTYAGRALRNLEAGLSEERRARHAGFITNADRILQRRKGDTARIRSLSEPQVARIAKGRRGKRHGYGSKVSICMDGRTCIVVGVAGLTGGPHDSSTLGPTLGNVEAMTGGIPVTARCDRGRRGRPEVNGTQIAIP